MKETHKLNFRQKKFVEAYLETGSATKAAAEAGYQSSYAQGAMHQPAVREYLEKRISESIPCTEVVSFLKSVMRGEVSRSGLRTRAAIQLGVRAGLWKNETEAIIKIEEELKHE